MMVALMLGLLLSGVVWSMYVMSGKQYQLLQSISNYEHQFTSISSMLRRDIAQAGYIGCAKLANDFSVISHTNYTLTHANKVELTDIGMTVRHASFPAATILAPTAGKIELETDLGQRFKSGQILIVSDCRHAEMIKVEKAMKEGSYQLVYMNEPLQYPYTAGAEVSRFETNLYYLAGNMLKLKTIDGMAVNLAEGLERATFNMDKAGVNIDLEIKIRGKTRPWFVYVPT